jgi:hypothetical protein
MTKAVKLFFARQDAIGGNEILEQCGRRRLLPSNKGTETQQGRAR